MIYFCCDERRRNSVANHPVLNGIDYLEVLDDPGLPNNLRQRTLFVHFLKEDHLAGLDSTNIVIEGGERIRDIAVLETKADPLDATVLVVTVDQPGDFSTYTLRLVAAPEALSPPEDFDPRLSAIDFSFKVACPSDFDCLPVDECPPDVELAPEINYLARDYASFRQLMLDRMATIMPDWPERNPADLGVALVELLAYLADRLSYQQDAVATEAYLGTARLRTSVKRHARLMDYFMHDGCNARAWVYFDVNAPVTLLDVDTISGAPARLLTRCVPGPVVAADDLPAVLTDHDPEVFELLETGYLHPAHNEIPFYTWGDEECCLPRGATRAYLKDSVNGDERPRLRPGDVIIFEERLGPNTGSEADADPSHRHAVRLTRVHPEASETMQAGGPGVRPRIDRTPAAAVIDPLTGQPYIAIEWDPEDALPFPLCLSGITDDDHGSQLVLDISLALGNVVLADHGLSITDEDLGVVPDATIFKAEGSEAHCEPHQRHPVPARFRPGLQSQPLTQQGMVPATEQLPGGGQQRVHRPFDDEGSATAAFRWLMRNTMPAVSLVDSLERTWKSRRDLLASEEDATEFVVEMEQGGRAFLRFGDDRHGERPNSGLGFTATYRIGNGTSGNVGTDVITLLVTGQNDVAAAVTGVRNPLPARGAVEAERIEDVRQRAPVAFRTQERAVTAADYAEVTERQQDMQIQQAAATFRWTGSWHTVFVTADRYAGLTVDEHFEQRLQDRLERYRLAGYDLEVDGPRYVPLEVTIKVCVKTDYFRSHVKAALLDVFSNRVLPDGRLGIFHPDNFTFGQPVYLSKLVAAAQQVAGVESVKVSRFQRRGRPDPKAFQDGMLAFERLEIARLDNDPSFPERGTFKLKLLGGK
ncbi:MAG: putative baseplate assembly protein [Chloroflexota bacterium]|nr:putative baseplate assembly protein [Chloroflexota bacterium]